MMTVLRWLLSHLLLLIFVAIGATAWLNRDQLDIDAILEDLRAPVAAHRQAREGGDARVRSAEPEAPSGEDSAAENAVRQAAQSRQPALDSAAVPPAAASKAGTTGGEPKGNGGASEPDGGDGPDLEQRWYGARQAYWDGDMAEAERRYQELIIENPDKADAYGELGNLYYSQGAWVEAAKMYYQAGVLLIEHGEPERAGTLVGILTALNPNLAEDLQNELDQVSRP